MDGSGGDEGDDDVESTWLMLLVLPPYLQEQEDEHSAGLCWMFVCLPPCFLIIENLSKGKPSTCFQVWPGLVSSGMAGSMIYVSGLAAAHLAHQLVLLGLGVCFTATCAYMAIHHPWVPAIIHGYTIQCPATPSHYHTTQNYNVQKASRCSSTLLSASACSSLEARLLKRQQLTIL